MSRILLADDDELVIDLITFKLQQRGHQVESLSDGELLIQSIRRHPPDLLILDYQLTSVTTSEIIAMLREDPETVDIPVIILSSGWREQDVLDALRAGINDFMTKPFSPDELLLRVELALRRSLPADLRGVLS